MTNKEFRAWRERHFRSQLAAATALELHRDTIKALEEGRTKNGEPYPVRKHIALMCAAVDHDLSLDGDERGALARNLRRAADLLESRGRDMPVAQLTNP